MKLMADQHLKKQNSSQQIEAFATLIIQLVINLRIKVFKSNGVCGTSLKALLLPKTETLSESAPNFFIAIWCIFYILLQRKVNGFTLEDANSYPNYLFMYAYHFILPPITHFLVASLYYIKHAPLRKTIWSEIKDKFCI